MAASRNTSQSSRVLVGANSPRGEKKGRQSREEPSHVTVVAGWKHLGDRDKRIFPEDRHYDNKRHHGKKKLRGSDRERIQRHKDSEKAEEGTGKRTAALPCPGRIDQLIAPGGWTVLYGENAEANDYLTLRVARPNDLWLHIRGATSAHVVVQTRNQPERVQRETLEFAARVAVRNSPSKHAGYVPVDYVLKKHVRKPRGASKGSALYTHEKTIHVEGH